MQFPNFVVYIIIQLAVLLLLSNIFMFLYNRKLARRNADLVQTAKEIPPMPKLKKKKKKKKEPPKQPPPPPPPPPAPEPEGPPTLATDGMDEALKMAMAQTEERMQLLGLMDQTITPDTTAEELACIMRFMFIETEKQALTFANDPDLLWETLQPSLDKLAREIKSRSDDSIDTPQLQPLEPLEQDAGDTILMQQLEEEQRASERDRKALELERKAKESLMEELSQVKTQNDAMKLNINELKFKWHDSKSVFIRLYNQIFDRIKTLPYRAEVAYNLDLLHNTASDLGTLIMGDNQHKVDSSELLDNDAADAKKQMDQPAKGSDPKKDNPKIIFSKPKKAKPVNDKDIKTLKTVVIKQREVIKSLENKLRKLETVEEKMQFLQEYETQVDQLQSLLTESNSCIDLLESEVTKANGRINNLETDLERSLNMLTEMQMAKPLDYLDIAIAEEAPLETPPEEQVATLEDIEAANPIPTDEPPTLEDESTEDETPEEAPSESDQNFQDDVDSLLDEVNTAEPAPEPEAMSEPSEENYDEEMEEAGETQESVDETQERVNGEVEEALTENDPTDDIFNEALSAIKSDSDEDEEEDAIPTPNEDDIADLMDEISNVEEEMGLSSGTGSNSTDDDVDDLLSKI